MVKLLSIQEEDLSVEPTGTSTTIIETGDSPVVTPIVGICTYY